MIAESDNDEGIDGPGQVVDELRKMVAEEMFLLGQMADDLLDGKRQHRLSELTARLDAADEVLSRHRRTR